MRLKLTLVPIQNGTTIPINYQYFVSTAIYNFLRKADENYSKELKEEGYKLGKKTLKFFTFSELQIPYGTWQNLRGRLKIFEKPEITLFVGTLKQDFFLKFVQGVFLKQKFYIGHPENQFEIVRVEASPKVEFEAGKSYQFKPLSSIFLKKKEGEETIHLTNENEDFELYLKRNLEEKYRIAYEKEPPESDFEFQWAEFKKSKRPTKLIKIKDTKLRAMFHPFSLKANPELLELGFECGFGSQNSEGFGMVSL